MNGGSNGKIIALIPIPLRIYAVQRKGLDCQDIGVNGGFRPGGVNFAGSDVFNIVFVPNPIVGGAGIGGNSVMYNDIFGDYDAA